MYILQFLHADMVIAIVLTSVSPDIGPEGAAFAVTVYGSLIEADPRPVVTVCDSPATVYCYNEACI